ncbi:MAG: FG-GAP repeat domain-containing protein, partial [Phycisphaerales bacterium]
MQTLFLILSLFAFSIASPVFAQSEDSELGDYFGFSEIEIIKIGDDPGPMYTADINSDGLMDILVINNRKSRIDILLQKPRASPEDAVEPT